MAFIAGLLVVALLFYWLKGSSKIGLKGMSGPLMRIAGGLCLSGALGMLAVGQILAAGALALLGLALLGRSSTTMSEMLRRAPMPISRLRTAWLEMEYDPASGAVRGRLLRGEHAGTPLDAFSVGDLIRLSRQLDPQSLALIEAYLDRRAPGWRIDSQRDAGDGSRGPASVRGAMTEEEAYEVLGLQPGAGAADVRHAHRSLMKKLHPDQGGSNYLASRVNQAKDIILRKHG